MSGCYLIKVVYDQVKGRAFITNEKENIIPDFLYFRFNLHVPSEPGKGYLLFNSLTFPSIQWYLLVSELPLGHKSQTWLIESYH